MHRSLRLSLLSVAMLATALAPLACKKKTADGAVAAADDKSTICLADGLGVRATPGKTGKFMASLSLGEMVKWTGDQGKDENGKDYLKVVLSDGKEGWASAQGLVTGAKVGAVKDDTVLHKRPDALTAGGQKVLCMSIIGVTQEKDGWVQVLGEGRRALGWIPAAAVTFERNEVATAIMATKKLREKDGMDRAAKVEAISRMVPSPDSPFIQRLRERLSAPTPAVPSEPAPEATQAPEAQN